MASLGFYNKFPPEIALMMWKEAISTHGVHHFRIFPAKPDEGDQLLMVAPWTTTKKDASTWRDRWNISQVDENSWEEYVKWVTKTKDEGTLWIAPFQQKKCNHPQHTNRAKVHGAEDLVVVTLTDSMTNLDILDEGRNRMQFRGLQRIAINWKQPQTGRNCLLRPFTCTCVGEAHKDMKHCPVQIVKLLHLFPDLKHFYFIFRITANDITLPRIVKQGKPTATPKTNGKRGAVEKGRVTKAEPKIIMNAEQIIEATLNVVHHVAKKQNLEIWSDSERTYYEVNRAHLKRLKGNHELVEVITNLKKEWLGANNPQMSPRNKKRLASTQFHFLVCRERINRK